MTPKATKSVKELSLAAKDEIGETKADIPLMREKVREIIKEKYPDLEFPQKEDDLFDLCLRARKFDADSAATQAHLFYKFLVDFYKMHNEIPYYLPSTHNKLYYDPQAYVVLKHKDHLGRAIILANYDKMPVEEYKLDQCVAASILMVGELTRYSVDVQRLGVVVVFNTGGFQFAHARQFSVGRIRIIARMIQGAFPVRIKGFHIVRCPQIFSFTYSLIRPFLREKMRRRIHLYGGSDLAKFHQHVSPDILPNFLGGKLSNDEFADVEFSKHLVSMDDYYTASMESGYMWNAIKKS